LVFVDGFDLLDTHRPVFRQADAALRHVAEATGTTPVVVRPTMRGVVESIVPRGILYGAFLLGAAMALGGVLGTIRMAYGASYAQLVPDGQHPLLVPLWSTEGTEVQDVGSEARRSEKILQIVARSPLALQHLRVCFDGPRRAMYNCGRCGKCVSTMLALRAAGVPDPPTFPRGPTIFDVLRHRPDWVPARLLSDIDPLLRQRGDHALAAAARASLFRRGVEQRLRAFGRRTRRSFGLAT